MIVYSYVATVTNWTDIYLIYLAWQIENASKKKKCFSFFIFSLFTFLSLQVITNLVLPVWAEKSQTDFFYSVTLFEKKCLPKPKLLLYNSILPLAAILLALFVMALMASKVAQIRLLLCEHFFSAVTEARVEYLHAKILRKRSQKRTCRLTSLYSKVCMHAFEYVYVTWRFFIVLFPVSATFLVSTAVRSQRGSTECCLKKNSHLLKWISILYCRYCMSLYRVQ